MCDEFDFDKTSHAEELETLDAGKLLLREINTNALNPKSQVEWGNAGTRVKMMIGTARHATSKPLPKFLGQLSFDRRTDLNLMHDEKQSKIYGPLTEGDISAMANFFQKVHNDLSQRLMQRLHLRMMQWHKSISNILTRGVRTVTAPSVIPEPPYVRAKQIICSAFDEIVRSWNQLQSAPWENRKPEETAMTCSSAENELLELYVAEGISNDVLRCEIGATQPIFSLRAHRKSTWHNRWPFSEAWNGGDYEVFVIQDFKEARIAATTDPIPILLESYENRGVPDHEIISARAQYEQVGSWVGMKIPRGNDKHWLLIAMTRGKNVWTKSRVDWLRALGKRLATVLRWWNAEVEREWFRHALSHELRKPMQNLEGSITNWLKEWDSIQTTKRPRDRRLIERNKVENLLSLVKLHGHMLADIQEITGLHFGKVPPKKQKLCSARKIIDNLDWIIELEKESIHALKKEDWLGNIILLPPEQAITHVLINLLLNAVKFNVLSLGRKVGIKLVRRPKAPRYTQVRPPSSDVQEFC